MSGRDRKTLRSHGPQRFRPICPHYLETVPPPMMYVHKERQARACVKLGRTYGENNCHERVLQKELLYLRLQHK